MPNLHKLVLSSRIFYKSIISVNCPILGETVYFTSGGFNHLLYHSNRMPRTVGERYMKLMCLQYAPIVLQKSVKITETRKTLKMVKEKQKPTIQYELTHIVSKNKTIRVIVEKIGLGKIKFLSVMPHDKKSKK